LYVASGVILDCGGHAVRGSGGREEQFGIYLARGASGATVKNCEVSGFLRGIRLQSAHHNRLLDNIVHHNGNAASHMGYGIDIAGGSTANTLQGNRVHDNADEGIHVGTGSHWNRLIDNHVYANFRENIYVLQADRGVFQRNTTLGGRNSLFLKHSTFNRFESNSFRERPAVIRGDSHDNQFVNNDFIGAELHFQAFQEGARLTRPTRNRIDGGTIVEARPCVRFSGAFGNILKGVELSRCATAIASTGEGTAIENTVIGIGLKPSALSLDGRSRLLVGWQLHVAVQAASGSAVGGAYVQGFDVRNTLVFEAVTAATGHLPVQEVIAYSQAGNGLTEHTPHTLQVTAQQRTVRQKVRLDADTTVTLSMPRAAH
jgi:parallel beta-helix repeat protein